jgi:hypothetical protein
MYRFFSQQTHSYQIMGWWWSSDSTAAPVAQPASSETIQTPTPVSTTTHREAPKKASPDSDFEALFASFEKPSSPTLSAPQPSVTAHQIQHVTPAPKETPTNYVPSPSGSIEQQSETDAPLDISPEALYPRQMSCRQAFDQAFYCQSLGGKFNDIYRYGEAVLTTGTPFGSACASRPYPTASVKTVSRSFTKQGMKRTRPRRAVRKRSGT